MANLHSNNSIGMPSNRHTEVEIFFPLLILYSAFMLTPMSNFLYACVTQTSNPKKYCVFLFFLFRHRRIASIFSIILLRSDFFGWGPGAGVPASTRAGRAATGGRGRPPLPPEGPRPHRLLQRRGPPTQPPGL